MAYTDYLSALLFAHYVPRVPSARETLHIAGEAVFLHVCLLHSCESISRKMWHGL